MANGLALFLYWYVSVSLMFEIVDTYFKQARTNFFFALYIMAAICILIVLYFIQNLTNLSKVFFHGYAFRKWK